MSVLRHGSSFFQRRLTKLYTDTKSSWESVSSASKPSDDPELVTLNRNFRTQKDRLLSWGVDWSDSSAAQPNDIDEALGEAGFSDVVASVMSAIQCVLNEAEKLQQPAGVSGAPGTDASLTKTSSPGGFPASAPPAAVKSSWTEQEIARSKELLEQLTAHIDTLYDLSHSRRSMSMSMASGAPTPARPPLSTKQSSKSAKDYFDSPMSTTDSKLPIDYPSPSQGVRYDSKRKGPIELTTGEIELAPFVSLHVETANVLPPLSTPVIKRKPLADSFVARTKEFCIDKSALQISETQIPHAPNPPPYEAVASSTNSRAVGQLKTGALPAPLADTIREPTLPILVEFSPISIEMQNSLVLPRNNRLRCLCESFDRLVDNGRVSHLGLLKFIGYFVDMTFSRYGFVYQLPLLFFPLLSQPSSKMVPKSLVTLYYSGDDRQVAQIPNLETRFRLAYNLILALLHLRSQNIVHGNINSHNVLIFRGLQFSHGGLSSDSEADFRHPYLTCASQFDGGNKNTSPEPLSSRIYRHPDDRQKLTDSSAWAYDLYSLGLVLLEIGLWTPLSRLWKMKYTSTTFRSRIENVYVKKLGVKCGSAYMQTVQLCLDAPNFHVLPEPTTDLGFRIPQTYSYPWQEPSRCNEWSVFSKNFVYTITKVLWRCCSLDVFSPPPPEDLEEHLPPPLAIEQDMFQPQESQAETLPASEAQHFGRQFDEPVVPDDFERGMAAYHHPNESKRLADEQGGNPEKRIRKRTVKRWSNEEIPEDHLQLWNMSMMPKISKLLQKILKDSAESCGVSLMIAGETPELAKTTICVTCTNVRKVRAALKKYFDYDREQWDLVVVKGDIKRSKVPRRKRRKQRSNKPNFGEASRPDPNPYYQHKPVCGASIGAFRQDEHLPPVSYGGAVLVDGVPYGMTVHHMLDSPCEDDDYDDAGFDYPPRSSGNYAGDLQISEQDFPYSWESYSDNPEAAYTFEVSDDEEGDDQSMARSLDDADDEYWLSDGYSSDEGDEYGDDERDDDTASIGDTAGVYPGEEPRVVVTQPAIDDVEDAFFPCPEDKDDDHLASHMLGFVHASSGIRRWIRDGIKHEVDWALLKIDENRMDATNVIPTSAADGRQPTQNQSGLLNKVASLEELGGLQVQCCGRTSGLQTGRISRALTLVKMHGRQSFSSSFSVDGNFGVPGDSGAWVFDKTGQVCGHVLAWSEKSRIAYIAPMRILLDDIARTLGARSVTLPASQEAMMWSSLVRGAEEAEAQGYHQQPAQRRQSSNVRDSLSLDLQKLNIDEPASPHLLGDVRGRKDVSSATYRSVQGLVPQSRAIQRQIA